MKDTNRRHRKLAKDPAIKEMESLSRDAGTFDLSLSIPLRSMTKRAAAAMEDESIASRLGEKETEAFRSRYRELLGKLVTERSHLREVLSEISRLFDEVAEKAQGEDKEEKDA